jgi:hypothetical protein
VGGILHPQPAAYNPAPAPAYNQAPAQPAAGGCPAGNCASAQGAQSPPTLNAQPQPAPAPQEAGPEAGPEAQGAPEQRQSRRKAAAARHA